MTDTLRDKLSKIYELVNKGATDGERAAAKKALDRIIEKYKISENELQSLDRKRYTFKYSTNLEVSLLIAIMKTMTEDAFINSVQGIRYVESYITYFDWVTIESAYEYFRKHMKAEWNKVCAPELAKCRKPKTRAKRRAQLEPIFLTRYIIESNLCKKSDIKMVEVKPGSRDYRDRAKLVDVEGGSYNKQVSRGLLLQN
jgi:hypothetical protein